MKEIIVCLSLLIGCTAFVFAVIYAMKDTEKAAIMSLQHQMLDVRAKQLEFKNLQLQQDTIVQSMGSNNSQVEKMRSEMDIFRDQQNELRDQQIHTREQLASKRPLIKIPQGPIQIEILPTKYEPKKNLGGKKK